MNDTIMFDQSKKDGGMSILLSPFVSLNYIKLLATKSLTLQHTFWWIIFDFANFDALK